jgi:hypothetical protein
LRHRARLILVLISLTGFPLILTNLVEQVLLEKLMVKKFPSLYETRSLLTVRKSQTLNHNLRQVLPVHTFISLFPEIDFNIILPSTSSPR